MFVNPYPYASGSEEGDGVSVPITVADLQGYQGNPFVINDDDIIKREKYDIMKMIDPGDAEKKREVWHMFPGVYEFTSDVFLNVPKGHVAYLVPTTDIFNAGCNISSVLMRDTFKGMIVGQLVVNGGEFFLQPKKVIAELVMQKVGE